MGINRWRGVWGWVGVVALFACGLEAPGVRAQGGEPPYFAIRGAKIVPVSGAPTDNGTIIISRGIIAAVGRDIKIPDEAWIIDGKGLTVYPGLIDAFTDIGLAPAGEAPQHKDAPAKGPEDRPGTTPWRKGADELNVGDKRIETWRNGGFTTVIAAPKGGFFRGRRRCWTCRGSVRGILWSATALRFR